MFAIIGIVVVLGAVMGGYLMEHGQIGVLLQPAELVIIVGAALGTLLIANPLVMKIVKGLISVLKGSPFTKATYLETLKMLNDLFMMARKAGMVKLEEDVANPENSEVFKKYPAFLGNARQGTSRRCEESKGVGDRPVSRRAGRAARRRSGEQVRRTSRGEERRAAPSGGRGKTGRRETLGADCGAELSVPRADSSQ